MPLIIDANQIGRVLSDPPHSDMVPVVDALKGANGLSAVLVYGGTVLLNEYRGEMARWVATLDQAGKARQMPTASVDSEESQIANQCASNDAHIIALARIGGARLLCTSDHALMGDFHNKTLVDKPRGKIYRRAKHIGLIRRLGG